MDPVTRDWVLLLAIVAIGAVLGFLAWRRLSGRSGLPEIDDTPDMPIRFGWKVYWLAVPSDDSEAVVEALQRAEPRFAAAEVKPCNWRSGFDRIYANFMNPEVFVSPSVGGWVLLVNWQPPGGDETVDAYRRVLEGLSRRFGEAYAFGSHRVVSLTMYAVAHGGELLRCVAQADAEQMMDYGQRLPAEADLNLLTLAEVQERSHELDEDEEALDELWDRWPGEQDVVELAARWSLDPSTLDQFDEKGVGHLIRPR